MEIARGPVSEAGKAAAGSFSRQAGTQGKAKILRTLLGGSFWDTCGFDVKAYFTSPAQSSHASGACTLYFSMFGQSF